MLWEDCEAQGMDDCIIQYRRYMDCDIHSHIEGCRPPESGRRA